MSDKFVLTIDCGNTAFDDGNRDNQIAEILKGIAYQLINDGASGFFEISENVYDINGNKVGHWAVKPAEYFDK